MSTSRCNGLLGGNSYRRPHDDVDAAAEVQQVGRTFDLDPVRDEEIIAADGSAGEERSDRTRYGIRG